MSPAAVTLVGPIAPRDVAHLFSGGDRRLAEQVNGYRGIPTSALVEALVSAGISVDMVSCAADVDHDTTFEGKRFRLRVCPQRSRPRERALDLFAEERRMLSRLIATSEGSIVHAHWTYEFAWAAFNSTRPVLVTTHDAPLSVLRHMPDAYRLIRTLMAYRVRASIAHLTAVSPYLASQWRRQMLYRREIPVIPNVAPFSERGEIRYKAPAKGSHEHLLVDVASSGRLKNLPVLLEAFALIADACDDARLVLIGPGLGPSDRLAQDARWSTFSHRVEFCGVLDRDALEEKLGEASLFVHPSLEESCPTAVLEAMSCGLPVIGGRESGGVPWLLEHGRSGALVDVRSPLDIASVALALLADRAKAEQLGERARDRVKRHFSPSAVASAYVDTYERVAGGSA